SLIKGKFINTVDAERMDATTSNSKINSMLFDEVTETGDSLQRSSAELENQEVEGMNQEAQLENNSPDAYVPISQACRSINNNKANHKKTTSAHQSDVHRPSLMKPNCTARTHEWDDSIGLQGGTSNTSKISLPSPKKRKLPPLKKYKPRREKRTWSELEEDNLRAGVKRFSGFGQFLISLCFYFVIHF
ncbi:telomeric repeat-binding factor, partial [Trifolium medium]|nr:telomeric repeat-binding factor [Trifolium medium]